MLSFGSFSKIESTDQFVQLFVHVGNEPAMSEHGTVIALWETFTYAALVRRNFAVDLFAKKYDNRIQSKGD